MNKRKLLSGSEVESFDFPIELIIHTKAPGKWKLIDLETGEEYMGSSLLDNPFSEILRSKVAVGRISRWEKIKGKNE